jgi:hypothetical protein
MHLKMFTFAFKIKYQDLTFIADIIILYLSLLQILLQIKMYHLIYYYFNYYLDDFM